ncbi:DUF2577 domain-containing protein [Acetatifactor aquisgranensis]|uniref:DUF2577 domain-containing protein n=1 Tax=Acetatifactor aquisgranensis TaxID=2941233 RepID=UPI0020425FD1|nr:DUF2577 domain-containing protein [Acetatifactor aquisgranensis]
MILLADANELVETLKRAAVEAMEAKKPVNVYFGEVVSAAPLKINVEQKMELGEKQLILSRNVTNFKTSISAGNIKNYYYTGSTEDSGTAPVSPSHVHAVGKIEVTVHNGLVVGDEVILIRQQGGQKFIVLDRIGS